MPRLAPLCLLAACLGSAVQAADPLPVEIVTATAVLPLRTYALTGEIAARDEIAAAFPVAGRLIEVLVREGDRVAAGDVLARLDPVQQQQALRSAEAGLASAQADETQAQGDFTRLDALFERGATTRAERDAAEDSLKAAAGALARAQAELEQAQKALRDTTLSAPQEATIIDRLAEDGQVVGAAQPVFDLALGGDMEAVFDVPEVLLTKSIGAATVTLHTLNEPDDIFTGTIREVSPLVASDTGTVAVKVAIPNPPARLDLGEAVRGEVSFEAEGEVVQLPWQALSAIGDAPAVWRLTPEGDVDLVPVTIDSFATQYLTVSDGLSPGDRIVGQGAQLLFPGRNVIDVNTLSAEEGE
ncbi:efflux RND transporter periplasmic adaptor subunit [Salipiger sp. 1_MG-2023]|uniref:efflux RND transporter periplasmic adaptor subunit n=1 Tax=Salipiger sp. 1_MG-2023 TaxID=3062665 RepID=UPI0026E3F3A0|nr:efflux RND transporter periplasmic adaptor subunit [Salipiger sp. 1_MG-2023]MDO6585283.1 efflux RND transporter periplasmic adaptor subunit [Salipiger sp. 1_MG-2023]